jgi:hypothetical protein
LLARFAPRFRPAVAAWSLAAGMSIFTLARRMGTSVQMIDETYGHLAQDSEGQDRDLLDADDAVNDDVGHWTTKRTRTRRENVCNRARPESAPGRI